MPNLNLPTLPIDIFLVILSHLPPATILTLRLASPALRAAVDSNATHLADGRDGDGDGDGGDGLGQLRHAACTALATELVRRYGQRDVAGLGFRQDGVAWAGAIIVPDDDEYATGRLLRGLEADVAAGLHVFAGLSDAWRAAGCVGGGYWRRKLATALSPGGWRGPPWTAAAGSSPALAFVAARRPAECEALRTALDTLVSALALHPALHETDARGPDCSGSSSSSSRAAFTSWLTCFLLAGGLERLLLQLLPRADGGQQQRGGGGGDGGGGGPQDEAAQQQQQRAERFGNAVFRRAWRVREAQTPERRAAWSDAGARVRFAVCRRAAASAPDEPLPRYDPRDRRHTVVVLGRRVCRTAAGPLRQVNGWGQYA